MIQTKTATSNGHATDPLAIDDWQDLEFAVLGVVDGSTVVTVQWRSAETAQVWQTLVVVKASPTYPEVHPGLFTMRIAPMKEVRIIATALGGGDTPFMQVVG